MPPIQLQPQPQRHDTDAAADLDPLIGPGRRHASPTRSQRPTVEPGSPPSGPGRSGSIPAHQRTDSAASAASRPGVLHSALRRFLLSSLVAFVAVAGGTVFWSSHIARSEGLGRAQVTGRGVANGVVGPLVTSALRAGDRSAMAELDKAVRIRTSDGSMYLVRIWTADQRLLYSDQPQPAGLRLDPAGVALFGTTGASAMVAEGGRDETSAKADAVEVSAGFFGADGQPLVFQAHLPGDQVHADTRLLHQQLLPLTLGSMGLLLLLLLPLAVSLARRVERSQDERNRMLHTSISASDNERRRIAGELHDTVIQDLAGLSYTLHAVAQGLPATAENEQTRQLTTAAAIIVRRDVDSLRRLMVDIYPPELADGQLVPMIDLLLGTTSSHGLSTHLNAPPLLDVPLDTAVLVYRVVREALRNAVKHAHAHNVTVDLSLDDGRVTAVITDDGVGLGAEAQAGHLGLRLLSDTVADAGGTFAISSTAGAGVRVTASVPVGPGPRTSRA